MMQNSLHDATEQLPLVHFPDEKPSEVIGKTTELAMKSGMFYGALNMINGIKKQMKNELLVEKVILTGGVPHSLISHIEHDIFAPDLPYEGMKYIYPKLLETNVFKT